MRPIDKFLERVHKPRRTATGYTACCPAHKDGSPSLSIKEGSDGRLLAHCHAGCSFRDIMAAVGLTEADAFIGERTRQKNYMPRSALLTEVFIVKIYEANPNDGDKPRYLKALKALDASRE